MDAADLRRLGRALREEERAAGQPRAARPPTNCSPARSPSPSAWSRTTPRTPAAPSGSARCCARPASCLAGGGTAEEALWELWDGTPWPAAPGAGRPPRRRRRAQRRPRPRRRVRAVRDRGPRRGTHRRPRRPQLPGGARRPGHRRRHPHPPRRTPRRRTPDDRAPRPRAWSGGWSSSPGVQEGLWPDLRRRGSLLEADRIGRDGLAEPLTPGALLAEERRLFYVAATRARERLVVTAVKAPADDGDQPSRFLTELGVDPAGRHRPPAPPARRRRARRRTARHHRRPGRLRRPARGRRPAGWPGWPRSHDDDGHPLVPSAHPYRWWGLYEPTRSSRPAPRPRPAPSSLSGSALDQLANTCALQWFLGREVKADAPATAAQGFGNVVHVLADEVASGRTPADLAVLMERLDSVWDALAFDAPWKSRAGEGDTRAPPWNASCAGTSWTAPAAPPVATEHDFDVTLEAGDVRGPHPRQHGPRRDATPQGRAYVVDFKTGKQQADAPPRSPATPSSPSTSSPSAKAPSTRSSTAHRPDAGRRRTRAAAAGRRPRRRAATRCPRCRRQRAARPSGVGRRPAGHRRGPRPGRALHPHAPASTAPTAPSGRPAAPSRRAGTSWSEHSGRWTALPSGATVRRVSRPLPRCAGRCATAGGRRGASRPAGAPRSAVSGASAASAASAASPGRQRCAGTMPGSSCSRPFSVRKHSMPARERSTKENPRSRNVSATLLIATGCASRPPTGPVHRAARCRSARLASVECRSRITDPEQLKELLGHPVHPGADGLHHRAARPAGDRGRSRVGQDHGDGGARGVAGRHRPGRPRAGARAHLHQQGGRRTRRARPQGAASPPGSPTRTPTRPADRRPDKPARASRRSPRTTPSPGSSSTTTACASAWNPPPACSPTPPATSSPPACCARPPAPTRR